MCYSREAHPYLGTVLEKQLVEKDNRGRGHSGEAGAGFWPRARHTSWFSHWMTASHVSPRADIGGPCLDS